MDGTLENLNPFDTDGEVDLWEITNGVKGINGNARHVMYVGGMDEANESPKDTRTDEQLETLEVYVKYTIKRHPQIRVLGHRQAPNAAGKACPSFEVPEWLRSIGVPEQNIFQPSL